MMHVRLPHSRSWQTRLLIDERDKLLIEAARFFGGSDREAARRLHSALLSYRTGRWQRRDAMLVHCPPQYAGRLDGLLWAILRTKDYVPSIATIRRVLGLLVSHGR
jgi:hypothetical protein